MTLNFPDSPSTGDIYDDSTSGFRYEWNGTVWISTDPARAANIKELDDISSGFNGSTTQFNLRVSSSAVEPVSDAQLLISVGGVMQNPTNDYTVSGSTITFTTAPSAGLTFFGVFLGQALSLNTVQDGTVEFASFKTGTAGVGIKSDGTAIGVGITQIDFVGSGNTVVSVGNTVSVYIAAGIDTTGLSRFSELTTSGLNVLGISSVKDLRTVGVATLLNAGITNLVGTSVTATNFNTTHANVTGVSTIATASVTTLTATSLTAPTGVTTNATNTQLVVTGVSTYAGAIDANGGANIAGGLVANSAQVSDLTSGRVTYAGSSGELQDSGNLTFNGSELTAASATVSDLTDNRVVIAGTSGALEDSSNLTFDGSTLTVNGDMNVQGELTYQEVTEIDSVGFVTARKGLRVTNGGIIVTAGISTINDDIKLAGANYDITYDRSADDIIFNDNAQAKFGTGGDLSIYHDGSHSYLTNSTGAIYVLNDETIIKNAANNKTSLYANAGDAVTLYNNNSAKLNTTSTGINVVGNVDCDSLNNAGISTFTGNLYLPDNTEIRMGDSGDFQLFHNASSGESRIYNSNAQGINVLSNYFTLSNQNNNESLLKATNGAAVELYFNNSKKIETTSVGVNVVGNVDCDSLNNAGVSTFSGAVACDSDVSIVDTIYHSGDSHTKIRFPAGDTFTVETGGTEAFRVDSGQRVLIGTTTEGAAGGDELTVATSGDTGITIRSGTSNSGQLYFSDSTSGTGEYDGAIEFSHSNQQMKLYTASTAALTLNSSQNATFAGSVSDSKGNLRSIPNDTKTSAYTLVASDAGKCIRITTGGVTVPNSVFAEGDAVTIINQSGSDQTITAGSGFTLYNSGDGSSGNRTLAGRGMATMMFAASDAAYISGAGLS